jgi:hypothetical protein
MASLQFAPPVLPSPPPDYNQQHWLQYTRALEIYFRQVNTYLLLTADSITGLSTVATATYAVTKTDTDITFLTAAACAVTFPNPAEVSNQGRVIWLRNTAAFTITSASSNITPLAGGAAGTALLPATAGKWARLKSNGVTWVITAAN